jgi:hypothetical protein
MRTIVAVILGSALALAATARASLVVPEWNSISPTNPVPAKATFYLDFDGDFTASYSAPPGKPPYVPGQTPAYDLDGDPNDFNSQELSNMQEIWARVSEIYSPFNVNVTTKDPLVFNNQQALKVVVGGNGAWLGEVAGGVSPFNVGAFTNSEPNLGFAFPDNLSGGDPKKVSLAAAHEAGHMFGLVHQSTYNVIFLKDEYNPGTPQKAPIMGNAYNSDRGLWWNGPSRKGWNILQDDMAIISATGSTANDFGYRPDDHSSTLAAADLLTLNPDFTMSVGGIIEQTTDADYFTFTTPGGNASFDVSVAPFGAMLDATLQLFDSTGTLLTSAATSSLGEHLSSYLSPGTYSLAVLSAGNYGDVGQYTLTGSLIPEPGSAALLVLAGGFAIAQRRRRDRSLTEG